MYAEREGDYLLFQHGDEGMQVLDTPFLRTVKEQADVYLAKFNSIPALLASVTIDLVGKQTMMM